MEQMQMRLLPPENEKYIHYRIQQKTEYKPWTIELCGRAGGKIDITIKHVDVGYEGAVYFPNLKFNNASEFAIFAYKMLKTQQLFHPHDITITAYDLRTLKEGYEKGLQSARVYKLPFQLEKGLKMAEFVTQDIVSEEKEENGIVLQASNSIQSFSDNLMADVTEQGYYATFAIETMDDKKRLFAAKNDNELLRDYMGKAIEVAHFMIDAQTINDPDVGAKTVPCAHIIATDGVCYQSASTGVVKSVCDIISSFGTPDTWDSPITVVCKETNTNNGYRYKYLSVE